MEYIKIRKIEAIEWMPIFKNISEVRAFIGFVTYYSRFIKNLSSILYRLNKLLYKKNYISLDSGMQYCFS